MNLAMLIPIGIGLIFVWFLLYGMLSVIEKFYTTIKQHNKNERKE